MKTYRMNAVMAGVLYFLGTAFGVLSGVTGGVVVSSITFQKPIVGVDLLSMVASQSSRITMGSFFILMMGISLTAMTVFLYPLFRKDSEELAMGMVLFRGALEGTFYLLSILVYLALVILGAEYISTGANSAALQSMGNVLYWFQIRFAPAGSILFIIGAICLYISFYRTRLIPRWLSIWGFIGSLCWLASQVLQFFNTDPGIGLYLEMVIAPQEIVMGIWLIAKGFNQSAITALMAKTQE
jgi:hypothetical protein